MIDPKVLSILLRFSIPGRCPVLTGVLFSAFQWADLFLERDPFVLRPSLVGPLVERTAMLLGHSASCLRPDLQQEAHELVEVRLRRPDLARGATSTLTSCPGLQSLILKSVCDRSARLHEDLYLLVAEQDGLGTHSGHAPADEAPGRPPLHFESVPFVELVREFFFQVSERRSPSSSAVAPLSFAEMFPRLDETQFHLPPPLPDEAALEGIVSSRNYKINQRLWDSCDG